MYCIPFEGILIFYVFLLVPAMIESRPKGVEKQEEEQEDDVDFQGNGYFSKLLIISFLRPLNEGYKVNTLHNKAPADGSFAHFQRPAQPPAR